MLVTKLQVNHLNNPLGFDLSGLSFSWVTEQTSAKKQAFAQIKVSSAPCFCKENIVYDSGKRDDISSLSFQPKLTLAPRTRYYWQVQIWGDNGESGTSETAWFETGKMEEAWSAEWITPNLERHIHPLLHKNFGLPDQVVSARAYVCGLGVYELYINGKKAGDEYLAPGFHSYDLWLQYQTYDITELLCAGRMQLGPCSGMAGIRGASRLTAVTETFMVMISN